MIGFVIISHNNPSQLLALIHLLNDLYDRPPISCHHDLGVTRLDGMSFPDNVYFVEDYNSTGWAQWSVTHGFLKALKLLYRHASPEWFFLLSAADMPIATSESATALLASLNVDALLDIRPVFGARPTRHVGVHDPNLACHADQTIAVQRYLSARIFVPRPIYSATRKRFELDRYHWNARMPFRSLLSPFSAGYRCYVGSQWFAGNGKVAEKLLSPSRRDRHLQRYMASRWHADESYVQTVLGNDEGISVDVDPRRFSRWSEGAAHPRCIEGEDAGEMLSSGYLFARKFRQEDAVTAKVAGRLRADAGALGRAT